MSEETGGAPAGAERLESFPTVSMVGAGSVFSIVFGLVFVGAGAAIALIGAGVISVEEESIHAPRWLIGLAGMIFALPGLAMSASGVAGTLREARMKRLMPLHVDEPWQWDHRWDERGGRNRASSLVGAFGFSAIVTLFAVMIDYFLVAKTGDLMSKIFLGLFAVLLSLGALAAWSYFVYVVLRRLKYRDAELLWDHFPLHLGEDVSLRFRVPAALRSVASAEVILRCVQEIYETRETSDGSTTTVVCFGLHESRRTIEGSDLAGGEVTLGFTLPMAGDGDARPTALASRPAVFWDLEVVAEAPGIDYHGHFLLPVYS